MGRLRALEGAGGLGPSIWGQHRGPQDGIRRAGGSEGEVSGEADDEVLGGRGARTLWGSRRRQPQKEAEGTKEEMKTSRSLMQPFKEQ